VLRCARVHTRCDVRRRLAQSSVCGFYTRIRGAPRILRGEGKANATPLVSVCSVGIPEIGSELKGGEKVFFYHEQLEWRHSIDLTPTLRKRVLDCDQTFRGFLGLLPLSVQICLGFGTVPCSQLLVGRAPLVRRVGIDRRTSWGACDHGSCRIFQGCFRTFGQVYIGRQSKKIEAYRSRRPVGRSTPGSRRGRCRIC